MSGRRADDIPLSTASSETSENVLLSSRAEKTCPVYSTDDQKKSHTGTSSGNGKSPNYSKESQEFPNYKLRRLENHLWDFTSHPRKLATASEGKQRSE